MQLCSKKYIKILFINNLIKKNLLHTTAYLLHTLFDLLHTLFDLLHTLFDLLHTTLFFDCITMQFTAHSYSEYAVNKILYYNHLT